MSIITKKPRGPDDPPRPIVIPSSLIEKWMKNLTGGELKILLFIEAQLFLTQEDLIPFSMERIMTGTGLSKTSIIRARSSLVSQGFLSIERQGNPGEEELTYNLHLWTKDHE